MYNSIKEDREFSLCIYSDLNTSKSITLDQGMVVKNLVHIRPCFRIIIIRINDYSRHLKIASFFLSIPTESISVN